MTKARVCMIAGLTAISGMMIVDASAQDCPEWLKWVCSGRASPNAVATQGSRQDKQLSRTKLASRSAIGGKSKPQQTQTLETARAAQPDPAISDGEKEALFQEFLEWDKTRRLNAEINQ
jgi:hypothetical protein